MTRRLQEAMPAATQPATQLATQQAAVRQRATQQVVLALAQERARALLRHKLVSGSKEKVFHHLMEDLFFC
jgi:hypothetical protein